MPSALITDFAAKYDKIYVVEELDAVIENHCRLLGINVTGKEIFGYLGEFSQKTVAEKIAGIKPEFKSLEIDIPGRPPVLCPGCPHRGVYYVLKKLKLTVSGDIGCYTLGSAAPLSSIDTCVCMGASISAHHGMSLARGEEFNKHSVAVIGDSTFAHSGITGLVNNTYNRTNTTVIVLDNSITGMTGHQDNPTTGKTLKGDMTVAVDIVKLAESCGYRHIQIVDPYDLAATEAAVKAALAADEPSLIISRRPCVLLKSVKRLPALRVDTEKCIGCRSCMRIGCPAISVKNGKAEIDFTQCVGCGVCSQMCKPGAIVGGDK